MQPLPCLQLYSYDSEINTASDSSYLFKSGLISINTLSSIQCDLKSEEQILTQIKEFTDYHIRKKSKFIILIGCHGVRAQKTNFKQWCNYFPQNTPLPFSFLDFGQAKILLQKFYIECPQALIIIDACQLRHLEKKNNNCSWITSTRIRKHDASNGILTRLITNSILNKDYYSVNEIYVSNCFRPNFYFNYEFNNTLLGTNFMIYMVQIFSLKKNVRFQNGQKQVKQTSQVSEILYSSILNYLRNQKYDVYFKGWMRSRQVFEYKMKYNLIEVSFINSLTTVFENSKGQIQKFASSNYDQNDQFLNWLYNSKIYETLIDKEEEPYQDSKQSLIKWWLDQSPPTIKIQKQKNLTYYNILYLQLKTKTSKIPLILRVQLIGLNPMQNFQQAKESKLFNVLRDQKKEDIKEDKWITPKEGGFLFACQTAEMSNQQYKVIQKGILQGKQLVALIGDKVRQNKGQVKNIAYICDPKVVIQAIDSIAGATQISAKHQKFSREGHASEIAMNFFLPFLSTISGNTSSLKNYFVSQSVALQKTQTQQKDKDLGILLLLVSQFFGIQSLNLTYISIKTHEFTSIKKLACSSQTRQTINMQYLKVTWAYTKALQIQNCFPRSLTLKGSQTYGKWYHTPYVSRNMLFFAFQQKDQNFKNLIKQFYQKSLQCYQSLMKTLKKKGVICLKGLIFGKSQRVIQIIKNCYTDIKMIAKSTREMTYKHTGFYQLLKEMIGECFEPLNSDISQLQNYFLIKLEEMQKTSKKISSQMSEADYKYNQVGTFLFILNCKEEEEYEKIKIYYVSVNQKWFDSFKCSESQDQRNQEKTTKIQVVFYSKLMVNQKKKAQDKKIQINTKSSLFVRSDQNYQHQYKTNLEKISKNKTQNSQNEDQSESFNNQVIYD